MIPSVLSDQIENGIKDFLATTFHVTTPFFHGLIEQFLNDAGSLHKGPYVSVSLPFQEGREASRTFFPEIPLPISPYRHQEEAFSRLAPADPKPAIIATGTGSGKTECFTYPILDHCRRQIGRDGIKAVLIYPMNALANDQAIRLARIISETPGLDKKVRVGMYVGEGEKKPHALMGRDNVITDKGILRGNPPDILITNYKMLDYLLIRPQDAKLWEQNGPETLRYIVVDELHTFDGAQGTDLACLIRRLKAKLKAPDHYICPVGTSATLGGKESLERLCDYATQIFGEPFPEEAIITERKKSAAEFISDAEPELSSMPEPADLDALRPHAYPDYPAYMRKQVALWTGIRVSPEQWPEPAWRFELGETLKKHRFFRNLLLVLNGRIKRSDSILSELGRTARELQQGGPAYRLHLLNSMLALISEARKPGADAPLPFLQVRIQHWYRELKRMVVSVDPEPGLRFADDLTDQERHRHLPVVHCRECGLMGWAGKSALHGSGIDTDLQSIYVEFFRRKKDRRICFLFPVSASDPLDAFGGKRRSLCASCVHVNRELSGKCASCGSDRHILVDIPAEPSSHCPSCGARNSLTLVGSQAASLTSVMIGQLYASNFNDDKKLLAFSDNVQDAAHRAAFFGARTYRFTFRTALQQFVESHGSGLCLDDLAKRFVEHWREKTSPEAFTALFVAPNMTWLHDFEHLQIHETLPSQSKLPGLIARRLGWEVFSEFGFSSRIGRTLEKSGAAVVSPDRERLGEAAETLCERLQNEIEPLRRVKPGDVTAFLSGMLSAIRQQGGIFHPDLEEYIKKWGNTYQISQRRKIWMPGFGPTTRAPAFVTTRANVDRFPQLLSPGRGATWFEWWASRLFPQLAMPHVNLVEAFFHIVFQHLERFGIMEQRWQDQHYVWGINPKALRVETDVSQYRCERCGHIVSGSFEASAIWEETPCFRRNCAGFYKPFRHGPDYYGHLYGRGDITRLYTEEHTGLLERDARQRVEENFKAPQDGRKPWYPNLLSSTPTLEMGIDIGDLSTTIQCSVPPGQANYLQRIGRSGRKDGNALNLTVANGKAHDLYFYSDPSEMIAGEIQPPGVFLDASAVLERQFTAYCFDCWIANGLPDGAIPPKLGTVLNLLPKKDGGQFPYNLIRFVTARQTELFDGFVRLFQNDISETSIKHLEHFVFGGEHGESDLTYRIVDRLSGLVKERKSLKTKIDQLYREINRLKANPAKDQNHQEGLNQVKMERAGLQALVKSMNAQDTFNFFTDEGLLPNYAFPESGITLNSIIYRKKSPEGTDEKSYESKSFTYERPSSAGIRELAPNNSFYADGRRVVIDKVDMRLSEPEAWRICDACPHMEREALAKEHLLCPRCGSNLWSDQGRKQQLLRIRQVFANTPDWKSRIADERDEREPVFYTTNILVNTEDAAIIDAFQIENPQSPFGFEFLARATMREINFGSPARENKRVRIAGRELERPGFVLCKHCGKVQTHNEEIEHDFGCPARKKDDEQNFIDCVYLYREFSSEAIKILLPVTGYEGSERRLNSFVAALHLGLKHYFGGSAYAIEHLQSTISSEPVADSNLSKQYLVIYDTVPGGTGFLKQLMRSDTLMKVLEKALAVLQTCTCRLDPEKDGCYACLFAYRNSYTMATTSRDTAIDMLSAILAHKDQLKQVKSLKNLSVNGLLDSELEALFLEGLRRLRKKGFSVDLKKTVVNGKPGYFLAIDRQAYEIEPQVEFGPSAGISIHSRVDFVFWPARSTRNRKPVAVFTDGYIFHKNRIGRDIAQRMAIAHSGEFHVWSITWKDVNAQLYPHGQPIADLLHPEESRLGSSSFFQLLDQYGIGVFRKWHTLDNFSLLASFLSRPEEADWQTYAFVQAVSLLDISQARREEGFAQFMEETASVFPAHFTEHLKRHAAENCFTGILLRGPVRLYFWARQEALQVSDPAGVHVFGYMRDDPKTMETDDFEKQWVNFLRLHNLFQFLPVCLFISQDGMDKGYYFALEPPRETDRASSGVDAGQTDSDAEARQEEWEDIFDQTDEEIHPLLEKLRDANRDVPEPGFELFVSGKVAGEAELAWPEKRIAYLREDQMPAADAFLKQGWEVRELADLLPPSRKNMN